MDFEDIPTSASASREGLGQRSCLSSARRCASCRSSTSSATSGALAMAIAASLAGAHVGAVRVGRERRERAPSAVTAAEAHAGRDGGALWWRRDAARVGLRWRCRSRPSSLNALRVRNCDVRAGIRLVRDAAAAVGGDAAAAAGVVAGLVRPWRGRAAPWRSALGDRGRLGGVGRVALLRGAADLRLRPVRRLLRGHALRRGRGDRQRRSVGALYQLALLARRLAALRAASSTATRLALGAAPARTRLRRARLAIVAFAVGALALWHAARAARLCALGRATSRIGSAPSGAPRTSSCTTRRRARTPRTSPPTPRTTSFAGTQLEALFGAAPAPPVHAFLFDNAGAEARAHGRGAHLHRQAVAARDLPAVRLLAARGDRRTSWRTCSPDASAIRSSASRGAASPSTSGSSRAWRCAASWAGSPLTPHQIVKVLRDAELVDARHAGVGDGAELLRAQRGAGVQRGRLVLPLPPRHARRRTSSSGSIAPPAATRSWRAIYGVDFATLRDEWLRVVDGQTVPPSASARWRSSGSSGRASSAGRARTRRRCASRRRARRRRRAIARARSPSGTRCAPTTTRRRTRSIASRR